MAYNKRINDVDLPGNYVDGSVLLHTDMNKLETLTREGINANYEDIQKLQDGTTAIAYATSAGSADTTSALDGAVLSTYTEEILQNNDGKVPTSKQVKEYVDAAVAGIVTDYPDLTNKPQINGVTLIGNKTAEDLGLDIDVPIYYFDGQNTADNVAMINEICDKFDAGEKFILVGKVALQNGYTYNGTFYDRTLDVLVPISVKNFTPYETEGETYYSFMTDPVRMTSGYSVGSIKLTGTWGNFTAITPITWSYSEGPAKKGDLATVAFSGSYNDLSNKPSLATVATTGDYADLTNKPILATVATTGDYDDLSNKPTIPTVNNATLTIQKNGTDVETFTANSSTNKTANITVPTKTSDLLNDGDNPNLSGRQFVLNTGKDSQYQGNMVFTNEIYVEDDNHLGYTLEDTSLPYPLINPLKFANTIELTAQDTIPTASSYYLGKVYQYTGTTDANYTNGYFYKCVSDGAASPTYSWQRVDVQPNSGGTVTDVQVDGTSILSSGVANLLTNTAYNASTNKIATVEDIKSMSDIYTHSGTISSSNPIILSDLKPGIHFFSGVPKYITANAETKAAGYIINKSGDTFLNNVLYIVKQFDTTLPNGTTIGYYFNFTNVNTSQPYYNLGRITTNTGNNNKILFYDTYLLDMRTNEILPYKSNMFYKTVTFADALPTTYNCPAPVLDIQLVTKKYVDDTVSDHAPAVVTLTQAQYEALSSYADNTEYHIIED